MQLKEFAMTLWALYILGEWEWDVSMAKCAHSVEINRIVRAKKKPKKKRFEPREKKRKKEEERILSKAFLLWFHRVAICNVHR